MATTVDNSGQVKWKPLETRTFSRDLRGFVTANDQQVPHKTAPVTFVEGLLESSTENERNVHKSRRKTVEVTNETILDKNLGTAWDLLQRFAPSWTTSLDKVNSSVVPAGGFLVVDGRNSEVNPSNFNRDILTVPNWITLVSQAVDDELGINVTTTESVVPAGTAVPENDTSTVYLQRQVDTWRAIRTTMAFGDGPLTTENRVTYEQITYNFPALLVSESPVGTYSTSLANVFRLANGFEPTQRRSFFMINPQVRSGFAAPVYARVVERLLTKAQADTLMASIPSGAGTDSVRAVLFAPIARDINYIGKLFNVQVANVLCNSYTITAATGTQDTFNGNIVETVAINQTNISVSDYIALIGQEVCLEDFVKPWKYGLYWRRRIYIKLL